MSQLSYIIINCHTLSYIIIFHLIVHLIVHYHTLYIVMRGSVSQLWEIGDKIGEIFQPTPSPSSTPHFKSLAEIILLGMISSLVF